MKRRAQTATEYLIILAVVIVIALIVVGVLGGIPSIGGGASASAAKAALSSQKIGVTQYTVGLNYVQLRLQNNLLGTISITNISANNRNCYLDKTPIILRTGSSELIYCFNVYETEAGVRYDYPLSITYIDRKTDAQYVLDYDANLVGISASTQPAVIVTAAPNTDNWFSVIRDDYTLGDIDLEYFELSTGTRAFERRDVISSLVSNLGSTKGSYYYINDWYNVSAGTISSSTSLLEYFYIRRSALSDSQQVYLVPSNVRFYGSTGINPSSAPWSE